MIEVNVSALGPQLDTLWTSGTMTGQSDAQLVGRFAGVRDAMAEAAFRELMNRHGSMVMGVCRQILRHPHDADDAFQATFLVLVRKGGSIRVGESLAPWLYTVAYRTAHRARAVAARYRPVSAETLEIPSESAPNDPCRFDLRPLLHEELNRLPGKYRDPIVLCHLEGKTHQEAARLLHWPVGTVSGRLSRGREILRSRLSRRGIDVSPAMLVANSLAGTPTSVAPSFIQATAGAAIGVAAPALSASVQTLAQGVQKAMLFSKLYHTAVVVALVGGVVTGAAVWGIQPAQAPKPAAGRDQPNAPQQVARPKASSQKAASGPQAVTTAEPGSVPVRPGRKKNSPRFPGVRTSSMVLVESPDRTAWQAYSLVKEHPMAGSHDKVHPGWMKVELPPGTTAKPIWRSGADGDIAALAITGKTIDRIAVFNPEFGVWIKERLVRPVEGEISPRIFGGLVLYQAGNDFYALTTKQRLFGILLLEGAEQATASISTTDIEVMQGNRLYVFSPKTGQWSTGVEVQLPPSAASPEPEEPAGAQKKSQ